MSRLPDCLTKLGEPAQSCRPAVVGVADWLDAYSITPRVSFTLVNGRMVVRTNAAMQRLIDATKNPTATESRISG
jgi:hypothetical protein